MANLPKLVNAYLGKYGKPIGVKACTLIKVTPGTHTPGAISAGTNPTTTSYAAKGFVADYSSYELANSLVQVGDRRISILGGSLPAGIIPAPNDKITIADASGTSKTYKIVAAGVKDTSNGAIFDCQGRG